MCDRTSLLLSVRRSVIVLCRPKEARNVGGCIRAAANAGVTTVRVVSGSKDEMDENRAAATETFAYDEIDTFSAGAVDLITVEYHDSLESAIGDCHIVIGTSGIGESKRGPKRWPCAGLRKRIEGALGRDESKRAAILFGNERHGLRASELLKCVSFIQIPTSKIKPSMNLAHAVACVCYELRRPDDDASFQTAAAFTSVPQLNELELGTFFSHAESVLRKAGWPRRSSAESFARSLKTLIRRANPSQKELNVLGGLFQLIRQLNKPKEYPNEDRAFVFVEPFYGGSHKQMIDILRKAVPEHQSVVVTLPPKKWHWSMLASSVHLAATIPHVNAASGTLFVSSMVNLAEILALRQTDDLASMRKVLYFHENQLAYPSSPGNQVRPDWGFGWNQIVSAQAADIVLFNSLYNMESFLQNVPSFLRSVPKSMRPASIADAIKEKSRVLHFPIVQSIGAPPRSAKTTSSPLHILWNHRWEHDKNADAFFAALEKLIVAGCDFIVSVLGEQFSEEPPCFERAKQMLGNRIAHWGWQERAKYAQIIESADVAVSTALHEFYGVSMLEAALGGCFLLVPNRLSYQHMYPAECKYATPNQLFKKLKDFCQRPLRLRKRADELASSNAFAKYTWSHLKPAYADVLGV